MMMVMTAYAHIDAGRLGRRRCDGGTRHQRCGQRKSCEKLLHVLSPDMALSHQN
jgi:hypothetical protein